MKWKCEEVTQPFVERHPRDFQKEQEWEPEQESEHSKPRYCFAQEFCSYFCFYSTSDVGFCFASYFCCGFAFFCYYYDSYLCSDRLDASPFCSHVYSRFFSSRVFCSHSVFFCVESDFENAFFYWMIDFCYAIVFSYFFLFYSKTFFYCENVSDCVCFGTSSSYPLARLASVLMKIHGFFVNLMVRSVSVCPPPKTSYVCHRGMSIRQSKCLVKN